MKCSKCQKEIPDNSGFCPYCGDDLRKPDSKKSSDQDVLAELEQIKADKAEQNNNAEKPNTNENPKKIICKKCNEELQTNFKRCPYCGTKVKEEKPKTNGQAMHNNRLTIILLIIIGILLVVSTVFITLYFSSKTSDFSNSSVSTEYTAEKSSDGYTKYICNTSSQIYHISNDCIAVQNMKNKKTYWGDKEFVPGKCIKIYDVTYEPCKICAW